jgi:hypothetical protein
MWKLNISRNIKIGLILLFVCALNANDRVIPEKAPFCISDFVSTISENEFLNFKSILVDDTMDFANYLLGNEYEVKDGLASEYFFKCAEIAISGKKLGAVFPRNRHARYLQYLKARESVAKELLNGLAAGLPPSYQYNILNENTLNARVSKFYGKLSEWFKTNRISARYVLLHKKVDMVLFFQNLRHEIKIHSREQLIAQQ